MKSLEKYLDKTFKISLILKGLNGFFEVIAGALLVFIKPSVINNFIVSITQQEIGEDPKDFVANNLIKLARIFSVSSQAFWVFYLLFHGIIKLVLIVCLFKKKLWAYPTAVVLFYLFMMYQAYQYVLYHSVGMLFLTFLDGIIIILTLWEYGKMKK